MKIKIDESRRTFSGTHKNFEVNGSLSPEYGLEHLYHLIFRLVPHGGADVNQRRVLCACSSGIQRIRLRQTSHRLRRCYSLHTYSVHVTAWLYILHNIFEMLNRIVIGNVSFRSLFIYRYLIAALRRTFFSIAV